MEVHPQSPTYQTDGHTPQSPIRLNPTHVQKILNAHLAKYYGISEFPLSHYKQDYVEISCIICWPNVAIVIMARFEIFEINPELFSYRCPD